LNLSFAMSLLRLYITLMSYFNLSIGLVLEAIFASFSYKIGAAVYKLRILPALVEKGALLLVAIVIISLLITCHSNH